MTMDAKSFFKLVATLRDKQKDRKSISEHVASLPCVRARLSKSALMMKSSVLNRY